MLPLLISDISSSLEGSLDKLIILQSSLGAYTVSKNHQLLSLTGFLEK